MSTSRSFDDAPDWDELARFRAGECAPAEAVRIAAWLEHHPGELDLLATLDGVVATELAPAPRMPTDVEAALSRVHARMGDARTGAPKLEILRGRSASLRRAARYGRTVLAAAAAISIFVFGVGRKSSTSEHRAPAQPPVVAPLEFRTAVGVVDSVTLGDGSRVLLAPSSRLVVSRTYGPYSRDVTIEGMARFTVRHEARSPFTVHVGNAVVRDVGTRFIVRTRQDAAGPRLSVAVLDGAVSLGIAGSPAPASLRAGSRAELVANGEVRALAGVAGPEDESWASGRLEYRAAPLDRVRDDLRRWYGIELAVADPSLASRTLTATFEGQSAEQVLRTIALALGADLRRSGSVATLRAPAAGR